MTTEHIELMAGTEQAWNEVCQFVDIHSKAVKQCDLIDTHMKVLLANIESDDMDWIKTDIETVMDQTEQIRKSTDLKECFEIEEKIFKFYDFYWNEYWVFGNHGNKLIEHLETLFMELYTILEPFGEHKDIKPE